MQLGKILPRLRRETVTVIQPEHSSIDVDVDADADQQGSALRMVAGSHRFHDDLVQRLIRLPIPVIPAEGRLELAMLELAAPDVIDQHLLLGRRLQAGPAEFLDKHREQDQGDDSHKANRDAQGHRRDAVLHQKKAPLRAICPKTTLMEALGIQSGCIAE